MIYTDTYIQTYANRNNKFYVVEKPGRNTLPVQIEMNFISLDDVN